MKNITGLDISIMNIYYALYTFTNAHKYTDYKMSD